MSDKDYIEQRWNGYFLGGFHILDAGVLNAWNLRSAPGLGAGHNDVTKPYTDAIANSLPYMARYLGIPLENTPVGSVLELFVSVGETLQHRQKLTRIQMEASLFDAFAKPAALLAHHIWGVSAGTVEFGFIVAETAYVFWRSQNRLEPSARFD